MMGWIPAFAGMTDDGAGFPAFAGMTDDGGNDG